MSCWRVAARLNDNNISECEMKRSLLRWKNSLFVGNERGGATATILLTLTSTCRRRDVDPRRYLKRLLTNLPDTRLRELDQRLPDRWKVAHSDPMQSDTV